MLSLVEYILEWDRMSVRRFRGEPWPWTGDEVLRTHRFSNIRRVLDRTNRLLWHSCQGRSLQSIGFVGNLVAHRMVSRPCFTLQAGFIKTWEEFHDLYLTRKELGFPVRPASYIKCASERDYLGAIETAYKLDEEIRLGIQKLPTLKNCWGLCVFKIKGLGKFTGWQLSLDALMLGVVTNEENWAHIGPGAVACLHQLERRRDQYDEMWIEVNEELTGKTIELEYEELEGVMCEYSRFVRYHTNYPGKYRNYSWDENPLVEVPLDQKLKEVFNEAQSA